MITNKEIAEHIKDLVPFKAFSVCGFYNRFGNYNVWSYQTAILEIKPSKEIVFFNNMYYSPTTSKVQNIICELLEMQRERERIIYTRKNITNGLGEPIKIK